MYVTSTIRVYTPQILDTVRGAGKKTGHSNIPTRPEVVPNAFSRVMYSYDSAPFCLLVSEVTIRLVPL